MRGNGLKIFHPSSYWSEVKKWGKELDAFSFDDLRHRDYWILFIVFGINVGIGQTVGNNYTSIKEMFHHADDISIQDEYNSFRALGCLIIASLTDLVPNKTSVLCCLAGMMTLSQLLFGVASIFDVLTTTSDLRLPFERIPMGLAAVAEGTRPAIKMNR